MICPIKDVLLEKDNVQDIHIAEDINGGVEVRKYYLNVENIVQKEGREILTMRLLRRDTLRYKNSVEDVVNEYMNNKLTIVKLPLAYCEYHKDGKPSCLSEIMSEEFKKRLLVGNIMQDSSKLPI